MGLLCRTKILFHSQMNLNLSALEPASAALGELLRLRQLSHAQQVKIETPGRFLPTWRHGELNVIDSGDEDFIHSLHQV